VIRVIPGEKRLVGALAFAIISVAGAAVPVLIGSPVLALIVDPVCHRFGYSFPKQLSQLGETIGAVAIGVCRSCICGSLAAVGPLLIVGSLCDGLYGDLDFFNSEAGSSEKPADTSRSIVSIT
jgi:hypothetical protein